MKQLIKMLIAFCLFGFGTTTQAQNTIPASGGYISLEIVLFPDPATDFKKLKIENYEAGNLRYKLYDINGNILLSNKVEGNETNIVMSNLVSATCFLR